MVTAPILIVQHANDCPPAWFGTWLTDAGARLDVRHPYAGQPLPLDLTAHSGLLVLGGPMGANDDDEFPWLAPTKALVRAGASHGIPVLGICLGHQLAAVALGGVVAVNPGGQQAGLLDVGWERGAAADPLMAGCGSHAVQWNNDVVTGLPPGSTVLARAGGGELQAARLAPSVWGVQWHPEAGVDVITPWAEEDRAAMQARGLDVDRRLREVGDATDRLRADWRPLATNFAAVTRHPPDGRRRTILSLDDDLVLEAQRLTGTREKSALVRQALPALIERETARRLAQLAGNEPGVRASPRQRPPPA